MVREGIEMIVDGEYIFDFTPEHHCNDLPNYIDIFLNVYKYLWMMIDRKENNLTYIKFCPYCGKYLRINFKKKPPEKHEKF